jgi:hypothetical protein
VDEGPRVGRRQPQLGNVLVGDVGPREGHGRAAVVAEQPDVGLLERDFAFGLGREAVGPLDRAGGAADVARLEPCLGEP